MTALSINHQYYSPARGQSVCDRSAVRSVDISTYCVQRYLLRGCRYLLLGCCVDTAESRHAPRGGPAGALLARPLPRLQGGRPAPTLPQPGDSGQPAPAPGPAQEAAHPGQPGEQPGGAAAGLRAEAVLGGVRLPARGGHRGRGQADMSAMVNDVWKPILLHPLDNI